MASIQPFLVVLLSVITFYFAFIGDLLLIIPINFVVLVRNLFPGRWRYKSFSWPYIHYAYSWVASGECYAPTVFFRPLTEFILNAHFRNRLTALRRSLLLEQSISENDQKAVLSKIDGALNLWASATVASVFFTYLLPASGPVIELCKWLVPASLPHWTKYLVEPSIAYALSFLATAFLVKRGLMLGATGRPAYFPGALGQPAAYAKEREILNKIGVTAIEFPLDIAVWMVGIVLPLVTWQQQSELQMRLSELQMRLFNLEPPALMSFSVCVNGISALIGFVAWQRRKKLQRL